MCRTSVFSFWILADIPKGAGHERVVTIFQVGHVLWPHYKMSHIYGWKGLLYSLENVANGWR